MKLDFKKNLGTTDKIIRTILVTGLSVGVIFLSGWKKIAAFIGAIFLFIDVIFSYCIGYDMFNFSTRE